MNLNSPIRIVRMLLFTAFFVLTNIQILADNRFQWKPVSTPSNGSILFSLVNSPDDFWINYLKNDKLFHFQHGKWIEKQLPDLPTNKTDLNYYYVVLDNSHFICYTVDGYYNTEYFYFNGNKWEKFEIMSKSPVYYNYRISENEVWFYGDWGSLFHYKDGLLTRIDTPISNHLIAFKIDPKGIIWIGTRNEGIYKYDMHSFQHVATDGQENFDISGISTKKDGRVDYYTSKGHFYTLRDSVFIQYFTLREHYSRMRYNTDSDSIAIAFNPSKSGCYYWINSSQCHRWELPIYFTPAVGKIISVNSLIFCDNVNTILVGKYKQSCFFTENAGKFFLEGNIFDHSTGCSFIDINNDNQDDIFVKNEGFRQLNRLYINNTKLFTEHVQIDQDILYGQMNRYAFGDLNNDRRLDLVTVDNDQTIIIYKQVGNLNFTVIDSLKTYENNTINSVDLFDIDRDNDLDIVLTFYYTGGRNIGNVGILENRLLGTRFIENSDFSDMFKGWNNSIIYADLTNDDHRDIFLNRKWNNDRIFIRQGQEWKTVDIAQTKDVMSICTITVDFDNDGDLDIINGHIEKTSISLLENLGSGNFKDISEQFGFGKLLRGKSITFICSEDFNNDGYIDLFLSPGGSQRNYLLLNDSAKVFRDVAEEYGVLKPGVNGAVCGDVDDDGDIDIFGIRKSNNVLWENRTDNQNYLNIKVIGSGSSLDGRNAKIWIYEAGHLDDQSSLMGYRELGTSHPGTNLYSALSGHFGVNKNKKYDLRVRFLNGRERILKSVSAGQDITVKEYSSFILLLLRIPGLILVLLNQRIFYYYFITILVGMAIIFTGIRLGRIKYRWDDKVSLRLLVFTVSVFWLTLYLFHGHQWMMRYLMSLAMIIIILGVSVIVSISIHLSQQISSSSHQREELLRDLLVFSHGEWASSSLNSLLLLCKNISSLDDVSDRFYTQLVQRRDRFQKLVIPKLKRILKLSGNIGLEQNLVDDFKRTLELCQEYLLRIANNQQAPDPNLYLKLVPYLERLKLIIRKIDRFIYEYFSCDALAVVGLITDGFQKTAEKEHITLIRKRDASSDYSVLIPEQDLADILDNCLNNSLKILRNKSGEKIIEINIYHFPPKVRIDIADNGQGISENDVDAIFQSGFSATGGTGMGLFQSRRILEKYGGRIYVSDTKVGLGTTISIELLKGVQS